MGTLNTSLIKSPAPVVVKDEVRSTNDVAAVLAREGAPHLTCVVANSQTAGRGRLGRTWATLPDHSLAVSFVIRDMPDELALVACLSLRRALHTLTGQWADVKWPNDLQWQEQKLAGILTEGIVTNEQRVFILGIGININLPATGIPQGLTMATVSQMHVPAPQREDVLNALIAQLDKDTKILRKQGFNAFYEAYTSACVTLGKPVTWQNGDKAIVGTAEKITPRGGLVLNTEAGEVECLAGDIVAQAQSA